MNLAPYQVPTSICIYCTTEELGQLPEPMWSSGPMTKEGDQTVQFPRDAFHVYALGLCGLFIEPYVKGELR